LKNQPDEVKKQVQENFDRVIGGIGTYRQKYLVVQNDYADLLEKYNQLTALSAQYLGTLQTQRDQIDQLLSEDQRQFHKTSESDHS